MIKMDDCYLTPDFLETFDFCRIWGRDFLRIYLRFLCAKLGFNSMFTANFIRGSRHTVPVRCTVGQQAWTKRYESRGTTDIPKFYKCPFSMWYEREVNPATGEGLTPFKLFKFDLRHSHPLSLKYEKL